MTASALIVMSLSWALVTYFTIRYFVLVLRVPSKALAGSETPAPHEGDAGRGAQARTAA